METTVIDLVEALGWDRPASPAVVSDISLPHQIVFRSERFFIIVSCNCRRYETAPGNYRFRPLGMKPKWDAAEAIALWRTHLDKET